jgi:hypothetical protein
MYCCFVGIVPLRMGDQSNETATAPTKETNIWALAKKITSESLKKVTILLQMVPLAVLPESLVGALLGAILGLL